MGKYFTGFYRNLSGLKNPNKNDHVLVETSITPLHNTPITLRSPSGKAKSALISHPPQLQAGNLIYVALGVKGKMFSLTAALGQLLLNKMP